METKVTVVLPTRNEEATIASVIEEIREEFHKLDGYQLSEIIVVDDSSDETRKRAQEAGADVVIGGGQGLGKAMYRGLKKASRSFSSLILSMDTDGQVDPTEIPLFIKAREESDADLVLGSRFLNDKSVFYRYPFVNRMGVRILVGILNNVTKLGLTDSHGGLRVMKREVAEQLELVGTHTYVQETIIDAVEKGFKVIEIPSIWNKREHGSSRIVGNIPKYIFYTLPILILRSGQHIRFLYPLGIFFILLSFLDFIIVGFQTGFSLEELFYRQSFHLIFLLFLIGINLFFFGFVIELLGNIKRKLNS